jgi:hypothetical protein
MIIMIMAFFRMTLTSTAHGKMTLMFVALSRITLIRTMKKHDIILLIVIIKYVIQMNVVALLQLIIQF